MHRAPGARRITATLTPDAVRQMEEWAATNLSSHSAEAVRAVRERAAQEARDKAQA